MPQNDLFPILDRMTSEAIEACEARGEKISCHQGCHHCCSLLVEISWEEAEELISWLSALPDERRKHFWNKIQENALEARRFFDGFKDGRAFFTPASAKKQYTYEMYEEYFFGGKRPCPLLEDGACAAYESRPVVCRLHHVSSPPLACSREMGDERMIRVPQEIADLKSKAEPIVADRIKQNRWGQLAIMLEAVMKKRRSFRG